MSALRQPKTVLYPLLLVSAACSAGSVNGQHQPMGSGGESPNGVGGSNNPGMGGAITGNGGNSTSGASSKGGASSSGGSSSAGQSSATGGTTSPSDFTAACSAPKLGSPLLRLLNRGEIERTLNDVFPQVKGQWSDSLPADTVSSYGFDNDASASVGNQLASSLLDAGLAVATAVTGSALNNILPCAANSADRACAETFLNQYGKRLFRRPLTQAEHDRYLSFFDASKAKSDFKSALKWMTVGLIQSPNTVYRREIGADKGDGTRQLTPHEIVTELAYTYAGSTPSDELLSKADSGNLGDPVALAKSLLATDRGKLAIQHFFEGYLAYTRVSATTKTNIASFADVSAEMAQETRAFIEDIIMKKNGGLKELLTAPTSNPSKKLAEYYGFPAPSSDYASVQRPAGFGVGILAQGSFLATHANSDASSPTQRGLFPFMRMFCYEKPDPPPDVPPLGEAMPGQITTRQRYEEQHTNKEPCASCHKAFDPIGFGFEHFDEGGKYRDKENGLTINAASGVPDMKGGFLFTFNSQEELATGLATRPEVYQCFAGYLATYAYGTGESCLGASKVSDFQKGAIGIADVFSALAAEPHFSRRSSQ